MQYKCFDDLIEKRNFLHYYSGSLPVREVPKMSGNQKIGPEKVTKIFFKNQIAIVSSLKSFIVLVIC